jgi:hypothetical protein
MNEPEKSCEIVECLHPILSRHRQDEGGHLCAVHFYALCVLESRHESLAMPEGPRRRYFINAVTIISQVQRSALLSWRIYHPHESPVTDHEARGSNA